VMVADGGLRQGSPGGGCGGGQVHTGAGVCLHGGEILTPFSCPLLIGAPCTALPCRCCLLLGGAPAAAMMKGLWRLCQRGPGLGAAMAAKGSQHGSGDGVLAAAACTPVASLMAVQQW
jgi:hypothetical protein